MRHISFKSLLVIALGSSMAFTSCSKDDDDEEIKVTQQNNNNSSVSTPATYEFKRFDSSSVSYQGQTDRLNQLAEMKTYIQDAIDNGNRIDAQVLTDMFENAGGNGNGNFSFSSSKQLKNKSADQQYFLDLFASAEIASDSAIANVTASEGAAGILQRTNGSTILVDTNGHEYTQAVEKGLMGATFYHQIVNTYLTDNKIGASVNNTDMRSGENYTDMEHHMDEAFGYFGAPVDFESNYSGTASVRYWAKYSNTADNSLQMNDKLMNAFKTARAAISAKAMTEKNQQVDVLNEQLEILIAATVIHYMNESIGEPDYGNRLHTLSEGFYFLKALKYANVFHQKLSQTEVNTLLYTDLGVNLWQADDTSLIQLKDNLSTTYGLDAVKNQL
jgi:hypothetical protein